MGLKFVKFFKPILLFAFWGIPFCVNAQQDPKRSTLSIINSRVDEENPILHPSGKLLYFNRANDTLNLGGVRDKGDIWYSEFVNNTWTKPKNAGAPINNTHYNRLLGFSPDGKIMFLHHHYRKDGRQATTQGLSYSILRGDYWSFPEALPIQYFYNKSSHQSGSLSADGRIMVLALDSYNSRGNEDIYVSFFEGDTWSTPRNLGAVINTEGEEMTPYLAPDNKTLYFSSNGHGGYGGRDLFKAVRLDDTWRNWTTPENLGSEVNSEGVELSLSYDKGELFAYYTSTRDSDGYGDIRTWDIPQKDEIDSMPEIAEVADFSQMIQSESPERPSETMLPPALPERINVLGTVINAKTNAPINGAIVTFIADNLNDSTFTDTSRPQYNLSLPSSTRNISIEVRSQGFMTQEETLLLEADPGASVQKDFFLTPLEVGETIKLDKLYFERGTANIMDDSFPELERLLKIMQENPNLHILLAGHTDNQGNARLNLKLSNERVAKVQEYLISRGISEKRVKGKGFGGTRPIASNASEETRRLNRRVEFTITKN
ncbi:MAG: OmpA family protein [Cyclobacteriaceae bacterium]|nr:OmpA family protein [Cyclobacteriaceae bacterium]